MTRPTVQFRLLAPRINKKNMAKKKKFIKLKCVDCKETNYFSNKSKALAESKLSLKKFCKKCRAHTEHKESKK